MRVALVLLLLGTALGVVACGGRHARSIASPDCSIRVFFSDSTPRPTIRALARRIERAPHVARVVLSRKRPLSASWLGATLTSAGSCKQPVAELTQSLADE